MKTFTAKEMNKSPAQVFRAADQDGFVKINHDRYPDKIFIIASRDRYINSHISGFSELVDPEDLKELDKPEPIRIYESSPPIK